MPERTEEIMRVSLPGSGLLLYHYDGSVVMQDYDLDMLRNWYDNDVQWSERWPLLDVECPDQTGADHTTKNDSVQSADK